MADVVEMKKVMSVDELLTGEDIEFAEIPGFKPGSVIRIKSVTAGDIIEWTEAGEGEAKRTAGLRLIVKSLVNDKGVRIADDTHIPKLRQISHKTAERIVREILKLNGMDVKVEAVKKD